MLIKQICAPRRLMFENDTSEHCFTHFSTCRFCENRNNAPTKTRDLGYESVIMNSHRGGRRQNIR